MWRYIGKMSDNEDEKKVLNFHQMEIDDRILKVYNTVVSK